MVIMAGRGKNLVGNITLMVQTEIHLLVIYSYIVIYFSIFHFAGSNGQGSAESYENLQAAYKASLAKREAEDANEVCKITKSKPL